jgi:Fur family ferric uptake transcriptional regulator
MTCQRQIILEELGKVTSHPTADEVYQMVRRRLPRISLGTVYRNLEVLSQHGLIQKLELGGTLRRFDGNVDSHYHIRCIHCGRVDDLPVVQPLDEIRGRVQSQSDYRILSCCLVFEGVCPDCSRHGGSSN